MTDVKNKIKTGIDTAKTDVGHAADAAKRAAGDAAHKVKEVAHDAAHKAKEVVDLWQEILPDDFIARPRLSRIYYGGKYYSYPLSAFEALANLGLFTSAACMLSFAYAKAHPIKDAANFHQWVRNQFGIGRVPQAVALEAEIFKPEAAHARGHHLGRPRTEVLHPANLYGWIMDVDPVVGEEIALLHHQRDGEEVAIAKRAGVQTRDRRRSDLLGELTDRR